MPCRSRREEWLAPTGALQRYTAEQKSTSYKQTDAVLSECKKTEDLALLPEVSSVPLQQTPRHQHAAFAAFFKGIARYPRFENRHGRQSAHFTRSAFRIKNGELWLAKTTTPLRVAWSWPGIDLGALDPTMVIVSCQPDGRWFVSFAVDLDDPAPLPSTGEWMGVDLGVKDFAVLAKSKRSGVGSVPVAARIQGRTRRPPPHGDQSLVSQLQAL